MRLGSALLLIASCVSYGSIPAAEPRPSPTPASTAAPVRAELRRSAEDLTANFRGTPGIWVADPTEPDPIFTLNPDQTFVAASLYKLALLLHVERLVEAGEQSYADAIRIEDDDVKHGGANELPGTVMTIDEALESMITYSDNGPALAFRRIFGVTSINTTLSDEKIGGFRIAGDPDQDNVVTPRAIATFLTKLADRKLVSAAASDRMLARLRRQHINDRLPRRLPAGVTVAHKTGDLVGYIHDVGIIDVPDGELVVVAMTSGASESASYDFIARLGSALYNAWVAGDPAQLPTPAPAIALDPPQQQGANVVLLMFVGTALAVLAFARRYSLQHRTVAGTRGGARPRGASASGRGAVRVAPGSQRSRRSRRSE